MLAVLPPALDADQTLCTAETRICPDGTAVGRSGPHCEFTACPGDADGDRESRKTQSGIRGTATVGPACPAMRIDPGTEWEQRCKDRPFQGTLIIKEGSTNRETTRVQTDAQGRFEVALPAGVYHILSDEARPYPRCGADAKVEPERLTVVEVSGDSGMR